ncbi:hypothetical protein FHS45_003451 [Thalassobacillus devorans]|nr:hypothetical protein [Thalassobacillus devorans]NIK30327.1 hypothetical protein [Thalassobacillus devorans]
MGCCSPDYQKMVEEEENRINENNTRPVPLWVKLASVTIIVAVFLIYVQG